MGTKPQPGNCCSHQHRDAGSDAAHCCSPGELKGVKDATAGCSVLTSLILPSPISGSQGSALARQIGAVAYAECSSKVSEDSVRDVFHVTTLASVNRIHKNLKHSNSKRGLKRASQMPSRTNLLNDTEIRKDRAKSCSIM